jgi:hypothetical protein
MLLSSSHFSDQGFGLRRYSEDQSAEECDREHLMTGTQTFHSPRRLDLSQLFLVVRGMNDVISGRRGISHILKGSVSEAVLRLGHARC